MQNPEVLLANDTKKGGEADAQEAMLSSRRALIGWRNGMKETLSTSRNEKSCTCGGANQCTSIDWGLPKWKVQRVKHQGVQLPGGGV